MLESIDLRPHHVEILNSISLLSDPEIAKSAQNVFGKTPLSRDGQNYLQQLALVYNRWDSIRVNLVIGPGDICKKCNGFNPALNQCVYKYPFDDLSLTPESNRIKADIDTLKRHPELENSKTLKEMHQISIGHFQRES